MVLTFSGSEEHIVDKILEMVESEGMVEYVQDPTQSILTFHGLEIHIHEQLVYQNHTFILMSYHEFFTILYLAQHPNWVFSKDQIYEAVWKESGDGGAAADNVVSQLRRKIGDGYIETVVGRGYKFVG